MLELTLLNLALVADELPGPTGCVFDCGPPECPPESGGGCSVGHGHWLP
jgi:hypothetical protein